MIVHNRSCEKHSRIFALQFGLHIKALQYNVTEERLPTRCIGKISFTFVTAPSLRFKNTAIQLECR